VNDEVEMMHAQIGDIPAHEVNEVKDMVAGEGGVPRHARSASEQPHVAADCSKWHKRLKFKI
jgi:hypothetical protein